jgi:hypothetical protein
MTILNQRRGGRAPTRAIWTPRYSSAIFVAGLIVPATSTLALSTREHPSISFQIHILTNSAVTIRTGFDGTGNISFRSGFRRAYKYVPISPPSSLMATTLIGALSRRPSSELPRQRNTHNQHGSNPPGQKTNARHDIRLLHHFLRTGSSPTAVLVQDGHRELLHMMSPFSTHPARSRNPILTSTVNAWCTRRILKWNNHHTGHQPRHSDRFFSSFHMPRLSYRPLDDPSAVTLLSYKRPRHLGKAQSLSPTGSFQDRQRSVTWKIAHCDHRPSNPYSKAHRFQP